MDGVALLQEARAAGLTVTADGDRLQVRGPRQLEPLALQLLARKGEVLAALTLEPAHRALEEAVDAIAPHPSPEAPEHMVNDLDYMGRVRSESVATKVARQNRRDERRWRFFRRWGLTPAQACELMAKHFNHAQGRWWQRLRFKSEAERQAWAAKLLRILNGRSDGAERRRRGRKLESEFSMRKRGRSGRPPTTFHSPPGAEASAAGRRPGASGPRGAGSSRESNPRSRMRNALTGASDSRPFASLSRRKSLYRSRADNTEKRAHGGEAVSRDVIGPSGRPDHPLTSFWRQAAIGDPDWPDWARLLREHEGIFEDLCGGSLEESAGP